MTSPREEPIGRFLSNTADAKRPQDLQCEERIAGCTGEAGLASSPCSCTRVLPHNDGLFKRVIVSPSLLIHSALAW